VQRVESEVQNKRLTKGKGINLTKVQVELNEKDTDTSGVNSMKGVTQVEDD
jgi:hypothetical protein